MALSTQGAARRRAAKQASDIALYSLGHLIETLPLPDDVRAPLRVSYVATLMSMGKHNIGSVLVTNIPGYGQILTNVVDILDHQIQSDPDHFLRGIAETAEPTEGVTDGTLPASTTK